MIGFVGLSHKTAPLEVRERDGVFELPQNLGLADHHRFERRSDTEQMQESLFALTLNEMRQHGASGERGKEEFHLIEALIQGIL